ncbi:MAG: hypothetical protein ABI894_01605 [Ilumatobacteraceae bacterium]
MIELVYDHALGSDVLNAVAALQMSCPLPVEPDHQLRFALSADGLVGRLVLDGAGAAQFISAVRIASTWDSSDDGRSNQQRSADALVDVCACFNSTTIAAERGSIVRTSS